MFGFNKQPDNVPEDGSKVQKGITKRISVRVVSIFSLVSMALCSGLASAETVNWSEITTMLDGVVTIFPSIASMVAGIMPTLMYLVILAFILRFFNSIIRIIESATNIFR